MMLLTSKQAARALRLSRRLQSLAADGTLAGEKHGRDWLFRPEDVEKAKQRQKRGRPRKQQPEPAKKPVARQSGQKPADTRPILHAFYADQSSLE
jgi:excisionase family DNA binding protein